MPRFLTLAATLLAPLMAVNALDFYVENAETLNYYGTPYQNWVNFTVCALDNPLEEGGSYSADCSIFWGDDTQTPSCWTACTGDGDEFYTRVSPSSATKDTILQSEFSVDIWQAYTVESIGVHNNGTVSFLEGENGWYCYGGPPETGCGSQSGSYYTAEETLSLGGGVPDNVCS